MEPPPLPDHSQGAFLGIFFFIIKYNGASLRPMIPKLLFHSECKVSLKKCKATACSKHPKDTHAVYIDDLSEAEDVNLKKQLVPEQVTRPQPLNYHERTSHIRPSDSSLLQRHPNNVESFTRNNKMKVNDAKSKIMLFLKIFQKLF